MIKNYSVFLSNYAYSLIAELLDFVVVVYTQEFKFQIDLLNLVDSYPSPIPNQSIILVAKWIDLQH